MKKIIVALSIVGLTYTSAISQTKTTTTTTKRETVKTTTDTVNYDKNYRVCKDKSSYYVCGNKPSKTAVKNTKKTTMMRSAKKAETKPVVQTGTKSDNAKNFKVCEGKSDYHICDEKPNSLNSVAGPGPTKIVNVPKGKKATITEVTRNGVIATSPNQPLVTPADDRLLPQSQSLNGNANNSLVIYDTTKNDTITNANAPYHGKPSPQDDGPAKNKARNMNTSPQSPNAFPMQK